MLVEIREAQELNNIMRSNLRLFIEFLKLDSELFFQEIPSEFNDFHLLFSNSRGVKSIRSGEKWLLEIKKKFEKSFSNSTESLDFLNKALLDIQYDTKENDEDFIFETYQYKFNIDPEINKSAGKNIKEIFKDLYTYFFRLIYNEESQLTFRDRFLEEYIKENNGLMACPSCLGEISFRTAQLDHYFPQSKFPVLSIHPFNLVPICPTCNTTIGKKENRGKGSKVPTSPLNNEKENSIGSLKDVYFPYKNSAELKIIGKIFSEKNSIKKTFKPILLTTESQVEKKKLDNHIDTFNLIENWTSKLPYLYMTLFLQTKKYYLVVMKSEEKYEKNFIKQIITSKNLSDYLYFTYIENVDNNLLRLPDMMLICSYVVWLLKNKSVLKSFRESLISEISEIMIKTRSEIIIAPYFYKDSIYKKD